MGLRVPAVTNAREQEAGVGGKPQRREEEICQKEKPVTQAGNNRSPIYAAPHLSPLIVSNKRTQCHTSAELANRNSSHVQGHHGYRPPRTPTTPQQTAAKDTPSAANTPCPDSQT